MIRKLIYCAVLFLGSFQMTAQTYTSYPKGNTIDLETNPLGGVCMMGGATENDEAMKWFLERASGGDILVLRASGSDGYNDYMYTELGITLNSVETIVFHEAAAADESYIHNKIAQAEGIWFAGGDQWDYISYWRNNSIANLINEAIEERNIIIGGTSAGMAILGTAYYSAENGTISSDVALSNPYHPNMTVDQEPFLEIPYLEDIITDTHYNNPDRKGRQVAFLSRLYTDGTTKAKGIACDEYTAVCIDETGMARVFGEAPEEDDNAYFIQINCELDDTSPEVCAEGVALDWNRANAALKVYKAKGTNEGLHTFNLNDWENGTGGEWQHWYVDNGSLGESNGNAPDCEGLSLVENNIEMEFSIFPNPVRNELQLYSSGNKIKKVSIYATDGRLLLTKLTSTNELRLDVGDLASGTYILSVDYSNFLSHNFFVKQ